MLTALAGGIGSSLRAAGRPLAERQAMDMQAGDDQSIPASVPAEDLDVLVVGAGMSGIGAAWHLTKRLPGTRFLVLEAQGGFGGT